MGDSAQCLLHAGAVTLSNTLQVSLGRAKGLVPRPSMYTLSIVQLYVEHCTATATATATTKPDQLHLLAFKFQLTSCNDRV
jgi:hypothetical protein